MIELTGEGVTLELVERVARGKEEVQLFKEARQRMEVSRQYIEDRISAGEVMYGINTGFGAFSSVQISNNQLEELQKNLIRSHSVGVGEPFAREQVRAIMYLRANALVRGHSGIRPLIVEKILEFLNKDLIPIIPSQGSVGASGDLAPLSHLALALIGEGDFLDSSSHGQEIDPLVLQAKEGLSLINGCQVMTAVGMLALLDAQRLLCLADMVGAMTLEALRGTRTAFDPLISSTRPHPGEGKTARNLNKILGEISPIAESHAHCGKVQDAYSLRCMPAVHGAAKEALGYAREVLEIEANSSTDNPLVFAAENKVLSCGNFHGEPLAFALDFAAIALSALVNMSECRIQKMVNPAMSGLPAFLAPEGGIHSGHMIVQVAAASLVSENKILSHPASVDSIPTSADKEDHVSMGLISARKFRQILVNAERIISMELLSAAQALDLLSPLRPTGAVLAVHQKIRTRVPFAEKDRVFSKDIEAILQMIRNGSLTACYEGITGKLEV